jgi:hypothetical protein
VNAHIEIRVVADAGGHMHPAITRRMQPGGEARFVLSGGKGAVIDAGDRLAGCRRHAAG